MTIRLTVDAIGIASGNALVDSLRSLSRTFALVNYYQDERRGDALVATSTRADYVATFDCDVEDALTDGVDVVFGVNVDASVDDDEIDLFYERVWRLLTN